MNVLLLHEYKFTSATNIIASKLIEELKELGVNVSNFYFYNEYIFIKEIEKNDIWYYSAQSSHSRFYLFNRENSNWYSKNVGEKIIYLITHPKFLFSYLFFKFDKRFNYKNGRRRLRKHCLKNNVDYIIGISAPHEIEKIIIDINIDIPRYIIRFDPYAFNPCYPEKEFHKRIEEEQCVLNRINKMFTTKLIIRDLLTQKTIQKYADKMIPIEIPFISAEKPQSINKAESIHLFSKDSQHVYLLHAGLFYDDIRNPQKIVDFMKELPDKYILLVAGSNSSDIHDYDSEIRDRIIDLGCLSRDDVKTVIEECDFLISYNNLNTNMVPSKLFECINSGKPFINLCQTDQCPTIEYVKDYDMAFTVVADHPLPKKELIGFLERTKGGKASREHILSRYEKCTVKYVAKQIYDMMSQVNR